MDNWQRRKSEREREMKVWAGCLVQCASNREEGEKLHIDEMK